MNMNKSELELIKTKLLQLAEQNRKMQKIESKHLDKGNITSIRDLVGDAPPSKLFYLLEPLFSYLLDNNPENVLSENGVLIRRKLNILIKKLGPKFLTNPQVFENRQKLIDPKSQLIDEGIELPNEPVIWVANHAFKDDVLATVLAAKRHSYILFGSLPQFFNTFDGITSWVNGVVMSNRKVKSSKRASVEKSVEVIKMGADLIVFPEGVWNKSPNEPTIDLWPGIYQIAKATNAKIIPVAHYMRDMTNSETNNPIHTVIDNPISVCDLTEEEAIQKIRDVLSSWVWLMEEAYGEKTTREELLQEYKDANEYWEQHLINRVKTADRYDSEIEYAAHYKRKDKILPDDVWNEIASINKINEKNAYYVAYANNLMKQEKEKNYQKRF